MIDFLFIGLACVLVAVVLFLVAGWIGSDRAIHPKQLEPLPELSQYPGLQLRSETVSFQAKDGTRLMGWFIPGLSDSNKDKPFPAVILLHGYASNRHEMLPHADILHRAGFAVLLFDFRAQGESEGSAVTFGFLERDDVVSASEYLASRNDVDATSIGVLGVSMGGATAIMAAADYQRIKAVAIEAAFSSLNEVIERGYRLFVRLPSFPLAPFIVWLTERRLGMKAAQVSPADKVGQIAPRPLLIMHGELDDLISPDAAKTIFERAGDPKELWLIPEGLHAHGALVVGAEYAHRIVSFFDNSLRG